MNYTFDEHAVSDLHKDAYGMRPSQSFWLEWRCSDSAGRQEIWDILLEAAERAVQEEQERYAYAAIAFESRIQSLIELGAADRAMAIRWMHQAEQTDGTHNHLEYLLGLPFGYINRA